MNKKLLVLASLIPLMTGCTFTTSYHGAVPYPEEALPAEEKETDLTVYFYYDFSHSYYNINTGEDEAFFKMKWYTFTPLGELPAEAFLTDGDAKDPLFPNFLGYSAVSTCMDESLLWDFATDVEESNTLRLFGVWVQK